MRKLHFTAILVVLFATSSLMGQSLLKKANKQFDLRAYDQAIENYLQVVNNDPSNNEVKLKLAESYRLTNQFIEAISWYNKANAGDSAFANDMVINYAHTLKNVGLYDKAQRVYQQFASIDENVSNHFVQSCDYAKELLEQQDMYRIQMMKFNTKSSDFGVSFFNDLLVFCSFDNTAKGVSANQESGKTGNVLYIENENTTGVEKLRSQIKEMYGIGPLSYSANDRMVAYTKNNFKNGYKQVYHDEENMSIYYALVDENGDFELEKPFPFNGSDYSTAFPHLSFGGSALYFSSNKLGGFGGFDLYVSYLKNGEWSRPENLGPAVNSQGNEITPFLKDGELYFSSDYQQGLGGYDIFKSKVKNGKWSFAENMGKGINSPGDDYYFTMNQYSGEMFFTSNRMGGRGNDDIYVASKKEFIELAVTDVDANKPAAAVLNQPKPGMVSGNAINVTVAGVDDNTAVATTVTNKTEVEVISDLKKVESSYSKVANTKASSFTTFSNRSLYGARKISYGEIINTNSSVFFIQLAALKHSRGSVEPYNGLLQFGNLYKFYKTGATKIKLGYYVDRFEADDVLRKVKSMGYRDAFVTNEPMNDSDMELVMSSNTYSTGSSYNNASTVSSSTTVSTVGGNYKVRLAAYEDPLWFDVEEVKDLGSIEQWSKGSWTIFILSGYNTLEQAQSALMKAENRGYSDAEIVIDNNGILERLSRN